MRSKTWLTLFIVANAATGICRAANSLRSAADAAKPSTEVIITAVAADGGQSAKLSLPRHDGPQVKQLIKLVRSSDLKVLFAVKRQGRWSALGYSKERHAHLLAVQTEVGAAMLVVDVYYLREKAPLLQQSRLSRESWQLISGLISPDQRYLAFVGNKGNSSFGPELYFWDSKTDAIHKLGAAPPALPSDRIALPDAETEDGYWGYFGGCCDVYFTPDTRTSTFTGPHMLTVDYAFDPRHARAQGVKRMQSWDLEVETAKLH